ncbi:helix-turn-helix domain-containing protein [[Mycobacterium] burgundiense]|uniref:Helix-turn-helix transcriptional regulator n=1 Tax=[Mycobacterium] burgundiense TaxID=3064286 RepID=A0ABM9L9F3_9MYCO|nr:helix-turn-helix transcriptional regulator [Mycolicibacterium sp. MU0053]CAJ1495132.1 helix-turn-helix transcriptional regulator [Mycolicibacterium sp. MU0053]
MSLDEARFAANVKSVREALGMTQAGLAKEMSARGFRWHQATVYKVENGDRQIQLGEGIELAKLLKSSVEELAGNLDAPADAARLRREYEHAQQLRRSLLELLRFYIMASDSVTRLVSEAEDRPSMPGLDQIEAEAARFATLRPLFVTVYASLRPDSDAENLTQEERDDLAQTLAELSAVADAFYKRNYSTPDIPPPNYADA